jgi:hypothetical protein
MKRCILASILALVVPLMVLSCSKPTASLVPVSTPISLSPSAVQFPSATEPPVNLPEYSLAVYMDGPYPVDDTVNYTKVPVAVTGWVNLTAARVTVNGVVATVLPDGRYYAWVQLKENAAFTLQAIATLGGKTDEVTFRIGVDSRGRLSTVPGLEGGGTMYDSRINLEKSAELEAGESKTLDFTLEVKKDIRAESDLGLFIYLRGSDRTNGNLLLPDWLSANFDPNFVKVYANTTYHFALDLDAATGLKPGEYPLSVEYDLGNRSSSDTITVKIDPPGTRPVSELPVTTQCQAAAIARETIPGQVLPRLGAIGAAKIGDLPNQQWLVDIMLDKVTREELGWVEGPNVQFYPGDSHFAEDGSYNLLMIILDANTGEVVKQTATNGLVPGYPSFWVTCRP